MKNTFHRLIDAQQVQVMLLDLHVRDLCVLGLLSEFLVSMQEMPHHHHVDF